MKKFLTLGLLLSATSVYANANANDNTLKLDDVFQLEYASQPAVHPDGSYTVFVRNYMDIMSDRRLGNLWRVDNKGELRPLTGGEANDHSPTWSPDGKTLAFVSNRSGSNQIHLYWTDTREDAPVTRLTGSPSNLSWSPDGKWLAFTMFTPGSKPAPVSLPGKPQGAEWAEPARYIDKDNYRFDGAGYAPEGYTQIYVVPASGGTPRQLTHDEFNHGGQLTWTGDSKHIIFSANRRANAFEQPNNSELYQLAVADGAIKQLTDRNGPDRSPQVSPDGKKIAWLGYDDQRMSYQLTQLYVMDINGGTPKLMTSELDYSVDSVKWSADSRGVYYSYDREGKGHIAYQNLNGKRRVLTDSMGGLTYTRPYSGGSFDVSKDGDLVFTMASPYRPADLMLQTSKLKRKLTALNEDALGHKELGRIEEIWYDSSHDDYKIQGWIAYPPNFDATKKYPLILEIHGGPHTAYAGSFAAEIQLMAAQGYVVLYTNPRGSTSYGEKFAQEIHHNYPSNDYTDLMDGVDAVIEKGFIDEDRLYVTGGSGGGVLTAWIVGHTDRFAAAVVAKPVINWYSFVLTADAYNYFTKYWFPGVPWEHQEHYMKYSPISYVGNVKTPTMLLTGEADYRTPISETEQYYQALKLAGVETAMVRIPDAPHGIAGRPSNLMSKVAYILHWFDSHKADENKPNE
ncbi:S9 family peptidase [Pseudidiomarina woesei]|uniref:Dipeptidyl aminopeptidase/acylaminoacyl peptidase n=1 Tax=Pseudidiomarina woesei TaxID=1381080 RepID=A0A0K6H724_9GAMM|nr:S9 family peptidase [Pseudidiomarina woesei]CUA86619.1 Dipeptidyl aminopeptidase/acylaminoacyl peptidase [Pseudidiomarina woesei]